MVNQQHIENSMGYVFTRRELLDQALTHKSFANEQLTSVASASPEPIVEDRSVSKLAPTIGNNERLEFLGDAVLDLALSALMMNRFPLDPEGSLSKKRASLVNEDTLARLASELKLEGIIRLGRGEQKTGGVAKPRILASTFEAVIGAVFLDGGYVAASQAIEKLFDSKLTELATSAIDFQHDYKTRLQERIQEAHRATPNYKVEREFGPDHDKRFEVSVSVGESVIANGIGKSKKAAEQDAAREALEKMT